MKGNPILFGAACWLLFIFNVPATVFYVDVNSTNPVPPYAGWSTASTDIQSAVDAASAGDTVLVTNGIYATGGRRWFDSGTNRVTLTNSITLQSVNGPGVTWIVGNHVAGAGPALTNAVRCVGMGNSAVLSGFTLTNGEAGTGNYPSGGGVAYIYGSGVGTVTNCILIGNLATNSAGGGAYRVTLINCQIIGNHAGSGGGADGSILVNCGIWGNVAGSRGGGTYSCSLFNSTVVSNVSLTQGGGIDESQGVVNSLIYNNSAGFGPNINGGGSFTNCCTTPLPSSGANNITNPPAFVNLAVGDFHLSPSSPCINAGNNSYVTVSNDLDGNPRIVGGMVDIGAYEFQSPIHFVDVNSTNPVPPYAGWNTASTDIQSAIDVSTNGDLILVTNGLYNTGGRLVSGDALTNRLAVTKAVTVQSVNGPAATAIQGYQVPGTTNGNSAVRCVYLTNNAALIGFTLTNGATQSPQSAFSVNGEGGGVRCESTNAIVSNCVLVGNSAITGAGAVLGTLNDCILSNNIAQSTNITQTLARLYFGMGGGTYGGTLNNCLLVGNSAASGGAVAACLYPAPATILNNCTIYGNSASLMGGGLASLGGVAPTFLLASNCIVFGNTAPNGSNYAKLYPVDGITMSYCCTTPLPEGGANNFTNDPLFLNPNDGDFHLQSNSPCINAGNDSYVIDTTDFDGNPRIVGGTVDIGAYEYQTPSSVLSYAWAQQYGLPTDGTADYADSDGDSMNNYAEWKAGTNPTNAASVLALQSPATTNTTGITVTWQSVSGVRYYLLSSTNLPVFTPIQSNLVGQAGSTSYTDTTATNGGPYFYRVGVQ